MQSRTSFRTPAPLLLLLLETKHPRTPASGFCSLHESLSRLASTSWTTTSLGFRLLEVLHLLLLGLSGPALVDFILTHWSASTDGPAEPTGGEVGRNSHESRLPLRGSVTLSAARIYARCRVSGFLLGDFRCFQRSYTLYEIDNLLPELSGLPFR